MKAELERISNKPTDSFMVRMIEREQRVDFKAAYHYHPEYELIWNIKSAGQKFIGNHISNYEEGELLFLGKNIPHCWISPDPSKQMVIQMREDFLGFDFLNTPECYPLRNMFSNSYRGLEFFGEARINVCKKLEKLYETHAFDRLLVLLDILNELANSNDFEYLATEKYRADYDHKEFARVQKVYNYIHENYKTNCSIEEIAKQVGLTKSSFCKFIKKRADKTFTQIVNEVRLGKATELLIESTKSISQICYEVGYNDTSYFFRQFSKAMGSSPKQFRNSYK